MIFNQDICEREKTYWLLLLRWWPSNKLNFIKITHPVYRVSYLDHQFYLSLWENDGAFLLPLKNTDASVELSVHRGAKFRSSSLTIITNLSHFTQIFREALQEWLWYFERTQLSIISYRREKTDLRIVELIYDWKTLLYCYSVEGGHYSKFM